MINLNENEANKKFFFEKKKIKMADSKKLSFSTSPKAEQFSSKFQPTLDTQDTLTNFHGDEANFFF